MGIEKEELLVVRAAHVLLDRPAANPTWLAATAAPSSFCSGKVSTTPVQRIGRRKLLATRTTNVGARMPPSRLRDAGDTVGEKDEEDGMLGLSFAVNERDEIFEGNASGHKSSQSEWSTTLCYQRVGDSRRESKNNGSGHRRGRAWQPFGVGATELCSTHLIGLCDLREDQRHVLEKSSQTSGAAAEEVQVDVCLMAHGHDLTWRLGVQTGSWSRMGGTHKSGGHATHDEDNADTVALALEFYARVGVL
ncbi:hypothetical protein EDB86DRAFT_2832531 [Lactarius hatsudake]|nr:hypothetical protein EDB86DRAFT_2832531 [Lactarius hatsudake]